MFRATHTARVFALAGVLLFLFAFANVAEAALASVNVNKVTKPILRTLDSTGDVGVETSIAIGHDGYPVVSYSDQENFDLKVAKCNDAACTAPTLSTLDSTGEVGYNTSIMIGRDGYPVVSYQDGTNQDLKLAKCNNAACSSSTLLTLDSVGSNTSIARGIDGYPVVAYYNIDNGDLKFLACGSYCGSGATIGKNQVSKVSSGLVGYWSFNGPDFTDKVYDRSGQNNHGYVVGAATSSTKAIGRIGQGVEFNGSAGTINAANPASLDNISSISIVGWVKADDLSTNRSIISKEGVGSTGWTLRSLGENLCLRQYFVGITGIWCEDSKFPVGSWTHIALTYDRSSNANDPIFYADGVATSSTEFSTPTGSVTDDGTRDLLIGSTQNVVVWDGKIDEVRVYNRILTPAEIKELYNAGR